MESSSRAGSIHCSKATADLLVASGRSSWVTERPDKINPKGKGEMTSYWVHPKSRSEDTSQRSGETVGTGLSQEKDFTSRSFDRDSSTFKQRTGTSMDPSLFDATMEA